MLYLTKPAFIANRSWHPCELVDCGCEKRALHLESQGLGYVVGRAYEYASELQKLRAQDLDDHGVVIFLNRCKTLPVEYTTAEVLAWAKGLWVPEDEDIAHEQHADIYETIETTLNFKVIPNERAETEPADSPEWVYETVSVPKLKSAPKPKRTRKKKAQAD